MAIQLAVSTRNASLDAIENEIGASAVLKLFGGTKPADCSVADAGTPLVTMNLPSNWMQDAALGSKQKSTAAWTGNGAVAGTVTHFRVYASGGTSCRIQGSCAASGTPDMTIDNAVVAVSQVVTVTAFTLDEATHA